MFCNVVDSTKSAMLGGNKSGFLVTLCVNFVICLLVS